MIKEVKYNGFTAMPSDYESPDGDLAGLVNLVPDNGDLKPVLPPTEVLSLEAPNTVIFQHETTSYTHYIVRNPTTGAIHWITPTSTSLTDNNKLGDFSNYSNINAIGNTLLIFTSEYIYYFLWQSGKYKALGNRLPTVNISFGLRGRPRLWSLSKASETDTKTRGTFTINFNAIQEGDLYNEFTQENQSKITNQVMAKVNKFLAENSVNKGRFCLPFFVRYALRLYDGSLVCHSSPILMNPTTKAAPVVFWKHIRGKGEYTEAECDIMLVSALLDYRITYVLGYVKLSDWSDIIKSVDIFISKPIYTYDQGGYCTSFSDTDNFETKFIGAVDFEKYTTEVHNDQVLLPINLNGTAMTETSGAGKDSPLGTNYTEWEFSRLYALCFEKKRTYPSKTINLPEYTYSKNIEKIQDVNAFYFLHSIDVDNMQTGKRIDIEIDDEYMQSLTAREVMTDDYLSNDRLMAERSHAYNNRLNLSGVKRELFGGFLPETMLAYCSTRTPSWSFALPTEEEVLSSITSYSEYLKWINNHETSLPTTLNLVFSPFGGQYMEYTVYIKENGETYSVRQSGNMTLEWLLSDKTYPTEEDAKADTNGTYQKRSWPCYFYYPNANAFKIIIKSPGQGSMMLDLKAHAFLNGAYATLDYETVRTQTIGTVPSITQYDNIVDVPNKLYTSDVNNPFRFDVTNINTIGTGRILGVATAAKALSQGQFGQFPLYAFTTEGVWAMEVSSSTGAFSARQPITRDVCINPDSITQIDSAVLFATDRGIMLLSGSDSQCISDVLDNDDTFNPASLPSAEKLITQAGFTTEELNYIPFKQFIADKNSGMLYDYTHQRIILYNPNQRYAYVYSMKDKAWGMIPSTISSSVGSYPEALAVTAKTDITTNDEGVEVTTSYNALVNFSDDDMSDDDLLKGIQGMLFTRPFKLDGPDLLKTIDTIIQRGYFKSNHVQQVLYGSRDLINWHVVYSSTDKYLRGFRGTPYKYFRLAILCQLDKDESLYGFTAQFTPRLINKPR